MPRKFQHIKDMSKTIFIVEYNEDVISGYKTFRDELIYGISYQSDIEVGNIIIDSNFATLTILLSNNKKTIHVPKIKGLHKYDRIAAALALHIKDSQDIVFLCNFAPAGSLLTALKRFFHQCKRVLILHDIIAAYYLRGDLSVYDQIIHPKSTTSTSITHAVDKETCNLLINIHNDYLRAFSDSNVIVCLCEDTYDLLTTSFGVPKYKIVLINNGLRDHLPTKREQKGDKTNTFKFIFVGRMTDNKGFNTLLDTIHELILLNPNKSWEVVCAGPVNNNRLKELNPSSLSKIRVLGSISRPQLYQIYPSIDAGLILSKYEQCSYAGIELKMFAIPIIAIPNYGVRNMCNLSNSILTHTKGDAQPAEIARLMKDMIDNKTNRNQYSVRSRDDYLQRYSLDKMIYKYIKLINELTSTHQNNII